MTEGDRYDSLVTDWQMKFSALVDFPLFKAGMMQNDRLDDYERLRDAEREARRRKDDFIETLKAR